VRINDRGPFSGRARIIDLSRAAAAGLGVAATGSAAVRVRRVEPAESDRARLRKGKPAHALSPISERERLNLQRQLAAAGFSYPSATLGNMRERAAQTAGLATMPQNLAM